MAQGFTNLPAYVHPFDLAGGGSIMTRATRDGILFANPAELPVAGIGFRWFGVKPDYFQIHPCSKWLKKVLEMQMILF